MDADIEATVDLAVRQARDVTAFTRELLCDCAGPFPTGQAHEPQCAALTGRPRPEDLGCATCGGTGRVTEYDPTSSAWFPKPPRRSTCRDCGGTGRDPAEETP